MGDGHYGWAAAEWLMMIRNLFVREEGDTIVIGSGNFPEWIESDHGPTLIPGGQVTFALCKSGATILLDIDIENWKNKPDIIVAIPGYERHML